MEAEPRTSFEGVVIVTGEGQGRPLLLEEPLSFWGGYDSKAGRIVDSRHPQHGAALAGRVLMMERAKGSSSSSSVLAEAIRNGTGPTAILMRERDLIVGLGCIVASELYGLHVPIVAVDGNAWATLADVVGPAMLRVVAKGERGVICVVR